MAGILIPIGSDAGKAACARVVAEAPVGLPFPRLVRPELVVGRRTGVAAPVAGLTVAGWTVAGRGWEAGVGAAARPVSVGMVPHALARGMDACCWVATARMITAMPASRAVRAGSLSHRP